MKNPASPYIFREINLQTKEIMRKYNLDHRTDTFVKSIRKKITMHFFIYFSLKINNEH